MRQVLQALSSSDFDALMSFCAPDIVHESVAMGATFERVGELRDYLEDLVGAHDGFEAWPEKNLDLGNGIGLAVISQKGRPAGSSFEVRMQYAAVSVWVEDLVARITMYTDIDEGRAAADRLAEERG
jgi:hypothetical protein